MGRNYKKHYQYITLQVSTNLSVILRKNFKPRSNTLTRHTTASHQKHSATTKSLLYSTIGLWNGHSIKGTIICQIAPRSYQIKLKNGNLTLRNIRDIKKVHTLVLQRPETMTAIVLKSKGTMITFMKTLTLTAQFHTGSSEGFRYWGGRRGGGGGGQ